MSDPGESQNSEKIEAVGADPDFVTTDPEPDPDEATPGEGQKPDVESSGEASQS
ncbi:hypothetical protein ACI3KS_16250 [Microbacterium sp. ZW T5_45]|uniref:hypothetical protein n=1 Tax=Microbacterium sp. ZW T5_45 TaxID=3378080 RepID=UPI0038545393